MKKLGLNPTETEIQDLINEVEMNGYIYYPEFCRIIMRKMREDDEENFHQGWLPDGYSQIFRSYVFGPSGFWTKAPLRYAAKFDPFLSLDCAPRPPPWRNPRKGRDQILPSGNHALNLPPLSLPLSMVAR